VINIKRLIDLILQSLDLASPGRLIDITDLNNIDPTIDISDILLVYITRLNLNFEISTRWQGLDDEWLDERLNIMQRFLVPSLKLQHDQNFTWLVLVHPDTPDKILDKIRVVPQSRIIKTNADISNRESISRLCVDYLVMNYNSKRLITARIDSDDAIHPKYGSILKKFGSICKDTKNGIFADFPNGSFFNLRTNKGYIRQSSSKSCGISRIEDLNLDAKTIFCVQHIHVSRQKNCLSIDSEEPMWVQTMHDSHINRPRKKLPHIRRQEGNDSDTKIIMVVYPYLTGFHSE